MTLWQYLLWLLYRLLGKEAVRLNLRISWAPADVWEMFYRSRPGDRHMAKIGDRFVASIAPTNAAGLPALVTETLILELTNLYDEVAVSADGLSVTFEAILPGSGAVVNVTAKSKAGLVLSDSKPLPDVDSPPVDEEAVALNLTITPV